MFVVRAALLEVEGRNFDVKDRKQGDDEGGNRVAGVLLRKVIVASMTSADSIVQGSVSHGGGPAPPGAHLSCVGHIPHLGHRVQVHRKLQKKTPELYPGVWDVVKKLLICLPSSSLVEHAFSIVTDLVTKKRSQLQVVSGGDLRLRVILVEPNINRLVRLNLGEPSSSR
ncbi:hypothetical protein TTRE_0000490001 [Trichuris trichiura]|uniref:Uncharacterized protein n=1 Tax=Trichuris trichiura TaxID=36087 RepID=A0A077ZDE7_TRITR|nr:hypothetical protein TTRE_0000490001 [Trichuris trichiura]